MSLRTAAGDRDDSGNSSSSSSNSSSSSVILSLEQLTRVCEPAVVELSSSSSLADTDSSLWQPDYSAHSSGYELADCTDDADVLLPLHRTVCCALCRSDYFSAQLSVSLFSSTQPNPTHQITDPTQPIPNRTPIHRTTGLP